MAGKMTPTARRAAIIACLAAGCTPALPTTTISTARPEGAAEGTCWAKQIHPAIIETSRTQTLVGGESGDEVYQTETVQTIVTERQELWFEVPCSKLQTPDFVASLQRALIARGYYRGPVTGVMDERTGKAVRLYQLQLGIDSQVLSLVAAQALGLAIMDFS